MKRAYVTLLGIALVFALALSGLGHRAQHPVRFAAPAADAPQVTLSIELRDRAVNPSSATVPKDHRVRLTVTNHGPAPASMSLAGYEDRVTLHAIEPGGTRRIEFLADRPGEDFAWLVNGRPIGRLVVAGSHLVGDHR